MKKRYMVAAVMAAATTMLAACGSDTATQEQAPSETTQQTDSAKAGQSADSASDASSETSGSGQEAATPSIDISGLKTTTLKDVDVDSLVTLGEYKGLTIEATKNKVTDEMVESSLNSAYQANPMTREVKDRAIQSGDVANIDYEGRYADTKEAFKGGTAQGYNLEIGSGTFIPGFEDGLIGAGIGETKDLNLTFPEDYGTADLAGKDVVFTVKINSITTKDEAPSDEWVKGLGLADVNTIDDYKVHLREDLEKDAEDKYNEALKNAAVEKAAENAVVDDIPEELFNRYFVQIYESAQNYVQQIYYSYGIQVTVEEYVDTVMKNSGITGSVEDYLRDLANQQAKRCMVLEAIGHKENIQISGETVDQYIQEDFDKYFYQGYSTIEEYKATFDPEDYREQIMAEKVAEYLVENASVK